MAKRAQQESGEGRVTAKSRVETDFGQSDFGQTDFGQTDFGQTDFGHPYFPTLAKSDFGQTDFGRLWPILVF